jgi:Flp pilus assembly protein TadG
MDRKLSPKEEKRNHILYSPEFLRNVGVYAADTMLLMLLMLMLILGIVQRGLSSQGVVDEC